MTVIATYLTLVARRGLAPDLAAKVGASDLVQETFLAAGRDFARLRDRSPATLRSWLEGNRGRSHRAQGVAAERPERPPDDLPSLPRTIRLWDPLTGQELLALGGSSRQINALAFSPDGALLISAEAAGLVRLHRGDPE